MGGVVLIMVEGCGRRRNAAVFPKVLSLLLPVIVLIFVFEGPNDCGYCDMYHKAVRFWNRCIITAVDVVVSQVAEANRSRHARVLRVFLNPQIRMNPGYTTVREKGSFVSMARVINRYGVSVAIVYHRRDRELNRHRK